MAASLHDDDLLDPHPDIHALFCWYDERYFGNTLSVVSVEWSSGRMTLCGGTTTLEPGGGVRIKLSEPLLKYRPARDLKMVLLHEMIHAHGFITGWWRADGDHGPEFCAYAARINADSAPDYQRPPGGYNITCTHNWMAEVNEMRKHHWKCRRCGDLVRRAMNRAPQPADCLTTRGRGPLPCGDGRCGHCVHLAGCGGDYEKIAEPEGYVDKGRKAKGAKGKSASGGGAPARSGSSNGSGGGGGGGGGAGPSSSNGGGGGGGGSRGGTGGSKGGPPLPPAKRPKGAPRPQPPPPRGAGGSKFLDWLLQEAPGSGSGGGGGGDGGGESGGGSGGGNGSGGGGNAGGAGAALPTAAAPAAAAKDDSGGGNGSGGDAAPPATLAELRQRCLDAALKRSGAQPQQQQEPPPKQEQQQQEQQQQQQQQQQHQDADVIVISDDE